MQRLTLIALLLPLICPASQPQSYDDYTYQREDGRTATIKLSEHGDSTAAIEYWVADSLLSTWELRYPVFQFCCGDVTGDNIPEIAVGVVKTTKYSQVMARRLFLFKLFEEELIRPLWLSSRVAHRLVDFTIESDGRVRTSEVKADGTPVSVRYEHRGFGLKFVEYIEQ